MSKFGLFIKRNSPEILLGLGITNLVASAALAGVASYKVGKKVITPTKKKVVKVHGLYECGDIDQHTEKRELRKVYTKAGWEILKLYAPAVISASLGVTGCIMSHNIIKGRNVALAAALTTLKAGYDGYRLKVKEKIGDEAEEELFKGESVVGKIKEKLTDSKGNEEIVEKEVKHYDPSSKADCDFGVFWGPGNEDYDMSCPQLNMTKLLQTEQYFNQKLRAKGYVFLEDVYKELGYTPNLLGARKMQASHVLGWIYEPGDASRDNYISFGIHDKDGSLTKAAKEFQCGLSDFIYLEFNVDDDILTGDGGKKTFMDAALKKGY